MKIFDLLMQYWYIILVLFIIGAGVGSLVYKFIKMPSKERKEKIIKWLVWACAEAEKELGSKTGKIKLMSVWSSFVKVFPSVASVITFETFSSWVDDALKELETYIESEKAIKNYIVGEQVTENEK